MDSCEMTVMNIDRKWKHGNKSVGIDLTKIDDSNHLKLWIYQMCIVLMYGSKMLGMQIKVPFGFYTFLTIGKQPELNNEI